MSRHAYLLLELRRLFGVVIFGELEPLVLGRLHHGQLLLHLLHSHHNIINDSANKKRTQ